MEEEEELTTTKERPNADIRELLKKYEITYRQLLIFIPNYSRVQRISEELAKPLTPERRELYLYAIHEIRVRKQRLFSGR